MNNLDTRLSVREIEDVIINNLHAGDIRNNVIVPNVSWGMGISYEADLVVVNRQGFATEYEIKRSYSDFVADFCKKVKMRTKPRGCIDSITCFHCQREIAEVFLQRNGIEMPAVLFYDDNGKITSNGKASYMGSGRKMFLEEQLKLARLGVMRYWNLRDKQTKKN